MNAPRIVKAPKNAETALDVVFDRCSSHCTPTSWSPLCVLWYKAGRGAVLRPAAGYTDSEGSAFVQSADDDLPDCTVSHLQDRHNLLERVLLELADKGLAGVQEPVTLTGFHQHAVGFHAFRSDVKATVFWVLAPCRISS